MYESSHNSPLSILPHLENLIEGSATAKSAAFESDNKKTSARSGSGVDNFNANGLVSFFRRSLNQSADRTPIILALLYILSAYVIGLFLLGVSGWAFLPGVLLLAHSLVIAAFLLHECAHQSLFKSRQSVRVDPHRILGNVLMWVTGACYSSYDALRDKHLRHHFERADIVSVDYRRLLQKHQWLLRAVQAGQWLCLPAIEMLMHSWAMVRPFAQADRRGQQRVVAMLLSRSIFFAALTAALGVWVLVGYALAFIVFISVMGFMDAFQHQYLLLEGLDNPISQSPTRDRSRYSDNYFNREYEQQHTFSNLISERHPWLNILVLNFCYHNAHHHRPAEPWWRLPVIHQQLIRKNSQQKNPEQKSNEQNNQIGEKFAVPLIASEMAPGAVLVIVPMRQQMADFFRYRVARVMAPASDQLPASPAIGAAGLSFLTPL